MHVLACPAKKEPMPDEPHDAENFPEVSDGDAQPNGGPAHVPERRIHARRRVASLEYVDLGGGNGGIIINLGEDGMYVQAVGGLIDADLPLIAFRVPESGYRVETGGRIIWIGESKKDAGIQFVNLPEEARAKIREWISSEEAAAEAEPADEGDAMPGLIRKNRERTAEIPRSRPPQKIAPVRLVAHQTFPPSVPPDKRVSDSPAIAVRAISDSAAPPELSAPEDFTRMLSDQTAPPSRLAAAYVRYRSRLGIAAMLVFVATVSLAAGWIASRSSSGKQAIALNPNLTAGESASASTVPPTVSTTAASAPVQISPSRERAAVAPHANVSASTSAPLANGSAAPHQTAPGVKATTSGTTSGPPSAVSPASSSARQPLAAPGPVGSEKLPAPAPSAGPSAQNSQPPVPEIVKGTVSVSASPPSASVPPGLQPKIAGQSKTVQIGQLISRVEPVYPESAERDRVEGVVKLRAIIGSDGTIRDIDQSSGPPPLVSAASAAVHQWRYTSTTQGGRPVEAEASVTVTFRLQVLPASTN
jgi:protein TonB